MSLRKKLAQELAHRQQNLIIKQHELRQLFWECTLRCNLHCRHCGSDCKTAAHVPDMPLAHFLHVLDDVATRCDPHNVFVVISGGEPLMRPDIVECGRAIHDKGFPWGMVTNALFLTPSKLYSLIEAGMHSITISIDGLQENHNWMRGNPHSFAMVSQALDHMRLYHGLVYDVVTCVNEHNYHELPTIGNFLIEKGVKAWRIFSIFPVGRAAQDPEMRLTDAHFKGMMNFIKETRQQGRIHASYGCEGYLGEYETEVRDHFYFCGAGVTVGSVLCDGSISACTSIRANYKQGNVYQDSFMDVWENRFEKFRDRSWMHTGECAHCKQFKYCRGNGMHLRDNDGQLLMCHQKRLIEASKAINEPV